MSIIPKFVVIHARIKINAKEAWIENYIYVSLSLTFYNWIEMLKIYVHAYVMLKYQFEDRGRHRIPSTKPIYMRCRT